jgi:hypothetical protein
MHLDTPKACKSVHHTHTMQGRVCGHTKEALQAGQGICTSPTGILYSI